MAPRKLEFRDAGAENANDMDVNFYDVRPPDVQARQEGTD